MIQASDTDLRIAFDAIRAQGGGEIALTKREYTVPGNYTFVPPPGTSFRCEYGATKIKKVGNGDFNIGNGVDEVKDFRLDGAQFIADPGSLGWACRFRKIVRSVLRDVTVDPVEVGWRNQFGIWIDGYDDLTLNNVGANARSKSLLINGRPDQSYGGDLYIVGGGKFTTFRTPEPSPGEAAIHIAGGCGGVYLDACDVIYSAVDLQIDQTMTGSPNREVFLGNACYLDSAGEDCLRIGPKACTRLRIKGWIATAGLMTGGFPNGNGINCHFDNAQLRGSLVGATIFNCQGTGAALGGGRWRVGGGTEVHSNGRDPVKKGYGVHRSNSAANVSFGDWDPVDNPLGDYHQL